MSSTSSNEDYSEIYKHSFFTNRSIENITFCSGGKNSRAYHVQTGDGAFLVKHYFRSDPKSTYRQNNEYRAFLFLKNNNTLHTPNVYDKDDDAGFSFFEFIQGTKISAEQASSSDIQKLAQFIIDINTRIEAKEYPNDAMDHCLRPIEIIQQISNRIENLEKNGSSSSDKIHNAFHDFLNEHIKSSFDLHSEKLRKYPQVNQFIPDEDIILSPSDFGFHNAMQLENGSLRFFDFEYFGKDDVVKLVSDTILHPHTQMSLKPSQGNLFKKQITSALNLSSSFEERFHLMFPLIQIKWSTILLNEFLNEDLKRREFSNSIKSNLYAKQEKQLKKSMQMLNVS